MSGKATNVEDQKETLVVRAVTLDERNNELEPKAVSEIKIYNGQETAITLIQDEHTINKNGDIINSTGKVIGNIKDMNKHVKEKQGTKVEKTGHKEQDKETEPEL